MSWPVSDGFIDALKSQDQIPLVFADVLNDGSAVYRDLPVVSGTIKIDSKSLATRSGSAVIAVEDSLLPRNSGDTLAPFGNEVKFYRGFSIDGSVEKVPLGLFRIGKVGLSHSSDKISIDLQGLFDRSHTVSRASFADFTVVQKDTNAVDAIKALVEDVLPDSQTYALGSTDYTLPLSVYKPGDNRWKAVQDLASSVGKIIYFDAAGVLVMKDIPDADSQSPMWKFHPGDDSIMTSSGRTIDSSSVFNHIIVTGQGTSITAPIRAEAKDTDPTSPTNISDFGEVVKTVQDSKIVTTDQAQAVADAELKKYSGVIHTSSLQAIPLPQIDAWDVIHIADSDIGLSNSFIVDQISIPLSIDGMMSINTRGKVG